MTPIRVTAYRSAAMAFVAVLGLVLAASPLAEAQSLTVLYSFAGYPTDGGAPEAGLLMDAAGNLYGTTLYGGKNNTCSANGIQCGTVFKLDSKGAETVLHNFNGPDGATPYGNLILDAKGDLYGTTTYGGVTTSCSGTGYAGCGVVFKLTEGKETVLHRFTGGADGAWPVGGVVMDTRRALYGTTNAGGTAGGGVAFKLVGTKETVLHSFTGGKDGNYITAGLFIDAAGNLYGTDLYGGDIDCDYPDGCGVVFMLTGKQLTVLHSFKGPPDGESPEANLIMDPDGNLYGTTADGGDSYNAGTVFELSPSGKERILHRFRVGVHVQHDGIYPVTPLARDAHGNLYGTTVEGGLYGAGVAYEITADGKEKILHSFCSGDCSDGAHPNGLIIDAKGNLYGTASGGGVHSNGTIFKITLQPTQPQ